MEVNMEEKPCSYICYCSVSVTKFSVEGHLYIFIYYDAQTLLEGSDTDSRVRVSDSLNSRIKDLGTRFARIRNLDLDTAIILFNLLRCFLLNIYLSYNYIV